MVTVSLVRYADDSVLGFQYRADAERFLRDWRERLQQFGLELHPDKTRLIEFGRFAVASSKSRPKSRKALNTILRKSAHRSCRQGISEGVPEGQAQDGGFGALQPPATNSS